MKSLLIGVLLLVCQPLMAVTIEFPEEELARESVLPVFDNAVAVKSRLVPTENRFEIGFGTGIAMNEPFFNTTRFGGHVAYHFTETHGVFVQGQFYSEGLGNNGTSLGNTDLNSGAGTTFLRMERAPQNQYHLMANYQITPYYGKISVFKDFVMNLSLYGLAGLGVIDIGGETVPAFNFGIGQKFYFSDRWGIRTDLGMMIYDGINLFQGASGTTPLQDTEAGGEPADITTGKFAPSDFARTMRFDMNFSISLIILL